MTDAAVPHPAPEAAPAGPKNKPATLALAAGLLSFVPGVGLLAIVAGLAGANRARAAGGTGRGRAAVGVVLGIGSLFLWAMLAGAYFQGQALKKQVPAFKATQRFVMLVGSGQVGPAKGLCAEAITVDRLTDTAEQFQAWGGFAGEGQYGGEPLGDGARVEVTLPFEKTTQRLTCDWAFVDGQPRLSDYRLVEGPPDASTRPAAGATAAGRPAPRGKP